MSRRGAGAGPTRRSASALLGGAALFGGAALAGGLAGLGGRPAEAATARHGMSVFGELKYGPDFSHFDYVDPNAPKGGRMVTTAPNWEYNQNPQTFDTLNGYTTRGDAAPRPELTFDSLMVAAADEPSSVYGLVARTVAVSEDGNTYTFALRPEARFHDGSPLTADDVKFSLDVLKADGNTSIKLRLRELAAVEIGPDREVVLRFTGRQSLLLPNYVVELPIFSAAYWRGRDFAASTLEPPLGSGPYRVGRFETGRTIEYDRVPDYWAADLPVVRGSCNFDVIRLEFFRERVTAFEAFKKGEVTWREEFTSVTWATSYDFPAMADGRAKKALFPAEKRPSLQAWFLNTRRGKFADPRTRQAVGLAFDFEWTNKNLFYEAYSRSSSFFEKSDYAAEGTPDAGEWAVLEPLRPGLPEGILGPAVTAPVSDGSGRDRRLLRRATLLLREAGWRIEGGRLVDGGGEQLAVEFLINAQVFERVLGGYVENLKSLGIAASIRLVDSAQYQRRLLDFDYDVIGQAFSLSPTPIEDVPTFFHSRTREAAGSNNYAGIADPAVDALLDLVTQSATRQELVVRMRALDRVLRAGYYTVPNWYSPHHRVAHWDIFGLPDTKPDYEFPFETTWWYDADKAARLGL